MTVTEHINKLVRTEHGMPMVNSSDKIVDTGMDSFGIHMVLLELDQTYDCFSNEWLKEMNIEELTIQDMVDRINNEGITI